MKDLLQFTPVTLEEARGAKKSALAESLAAFIASDDIAVRVEWRGKYVTATSCGNTIRVCLRRHRQRDLVQVREINGALYLIKKHLSK